MMACPNCGKTVTDDTMQFCPACGFSFHQQMNQQYGPNQYGPQYYAPTTYPKKNAAIAVLLSFFIGGLGQIYVGKIKRGIAFIITFVIISVLEVVSVSGIDYNDLNAIQDLTNSPTFIILSFVSLGFWLFSMYDAYRMTAKYNQAAMRNDLARFLKEF